MKRVFLSILYCLPVIGSYGQMNPGPGGIGTGNWVLWLDASKDVYTDAGVTSCTDTDPVEEWHDQSGAGNDLLQTTAADKPIYRAGIVNGEPILRFDGASDYLESAGFATLVIANFTWIALMNYDVSPDEDDAIFAANSSEASENIQIGPAEHSGSGMELTIEGTGGVNQYSELDPMSNYESTNRVSVVNRYFDVIGGSDFAFCTRDGSIQFDAGLGPSPGLATDWDLYKIGEDRGGGEFMDGDLAEMLIYHRLFNSAERIIMENYMGAKYGIALTANDYYAGDDVVNGDYDTDVVGVGTDNTAPATGSNTLAGSAGMEMTQTSGFGNGDFILWGHKVTSNFTNTTDIAGIPGLEGRWDRIWYVDVTDAGGTATVDLVFDFSDAGVGGGPGAPVSNYKLIFSATGSGPWTDAGTGSSIAGDRITFSGEDFTANGNGYYGLGSLNLAASPLPIELIYFDADAIDNDVLLKWATASEINNDYFTIERSVDAVTFEKFLNVDGAGNSNIVRNYEAIDKNLMPGVYYYRLIDTDFDGIENASYVVAVEVKLDEPGFTIYPNPANTHLLVDLPSSLFDYQNQNNPDLDYNILLTDVLHYEVMHSQLKSVSNQLDISNLANGVYIYRLLIDKQLVDTGKLVIQH